MKKIRNQIVARFGRHILIFVMKIVNLQFKVATREVVEEMGMTDDEDGTIVDSSRKFSQPIWNIIICFLTLKSQNATEKDG